MTPPDQKLWWQNAPMEEDAYVMSMMFSTALALPVGLVGGEQYGDPFTSVAAVVVWCGAAYLCFKWMNRFERKKHLVRQALEKKYA